MTEKEVEWAKDWIKTKAKMNLDEKAVTDMAKILCNYHHDRIKNGLANIIGALSKEKIDLA